MNSGTRTAYTETQKMESIWAQVKVQLEREMPTEDFVRFARVLRVVGSEDGMITLAAPDEVACAWLESHLRETILGHLAEVSKDIQGVHFIVETDSPTGAGEQSEAGQVKDEGKTVVEIHAADVWTKIVERLSSPTLSSLEIERGLRGVRALGFRHGSENLVVSVPDQESLAWLKEHLGYEITRGLREMLDSDSALPEIVIGGEEPQDDQPVKPGMDPERAWQIVLGQLQMEMPKASFDTWVRETRALGFKDGVLIVGVRNAYAREWLESRLSSTVSRLLIGIMNQQVDVRFVVSEGGPYKSEGEAPHEEGDEDTEEANTDEGAEVRARFAYVSRYQEIVKPHRVIVLEGYILRLLPEIGPRLFWTYVGFRQAGWAHSRGKAKGSLTFRVPASQVARYAGVSRATLFSWMAKKGFWDMLRGLVEKTDEEPKWVVGPDARKHQAANEYTVHMTLPLSWADALALKTWLAERMERMSLSEALMAALEIPAGQLVGQIFLPIGAQPTLEVARRTLPDRPLTAIDVARRLSNGDLSKEDRLLAETLHTKIVSAFGTIGIMHYFVEKVIPQAKLTPEQAAFIVAARSRCYANPKTGEIRNRVTVGGGFEEIAAWIGLSRTRTVWEWLTGRVDKKRLNDERNVVARKTVKGEGTIPAFVRLEGELRRGAASAKKELTVRLMEPLFDGTQTHNIDGTLTHSGDGTQTLRNDGISTHRIDGSQTHKNDGTQTDLWRNWDGLNDSYNLLLTLGMTKETITDITGKRVGDSPSPLKWSLGALLVQNEIYPVNIKKILARDIPAQYVVAWLLYCFSPAGNNLDPSRTLVSNLMHKDPPETPGDPYDRLANLSPRIIHELVKATPAYGDNAGGTGNSDWDRTVGPSNPRIDELRQRLFGVE